MYLRFVVPDIDEDSGMELGVFHAVRNLREEGKLYRYEEERHDLIRQWFNENLEKPTRFTASKPPFYRKPNKAISWFKDSANEHLNYVRELVAILQNHGVIVQLLKTDRVGYVVYAKVDAKLLQAGAKLGGAVRNKKTFDADDSYADFAGFERCVRRILEPGDNARDSRAKSRRTCQAVANEPYVLLARAAADSVGSSSRAAHISAR